MSSRFSASTCVTGGRMSADTEIMIALLLKGTRALDSKSSSSSSSASTDLTLFTPGKDPPCAIREGLNKTYFREPLCFRCNYYGHMRRDCPFCQVL